MGALRDLLVEEPLVLASEDNRDWPRAGEREDVCRAVARRLHMLAVQPLAGRRPDDGDAVGDRLLERRELLAAFQYVRRVHGEAHPLLPVVLEVRRGEAQAAYPHVGHRAAARADVARVERADEDYAYVLKRVHYGCLTFLSRDL